MKQKTLALICAPGARTCKSCLKRRERVMPWAELLALITPRAPVASTRRPPFDPASEPRQRACCGTWRCALASAGRRNRRPGVNWPRKRKSSTPMCGPSCSILLESSIASLDTPKCATAALHKTPLAHHAVCVGQYLDGQNHAFAQAKGMRALAHSQGATKKEIKHNLAQPCTGVIDADV